MKKIIDIGPTPRDADTESQKAANPMKTTAAVYTLIVSSDVLTLDPVWIYN